MALTPVVSGLRPALYERFWPRRAARSARSRSTSRRQDCRTTWSSPDAGRVGRSIADALSHLTLPFVLDRVRRSPRAAGARGGLAGDLRRRQPARRARGGGRRVARGPCWSRCPRFADVRSIVSAGRQLRPDLPIIARADSAEAVRALYALGIQEVTSPEFEAAIEMTRQALIYFNVPAHDVLRVASAIRRERYDVPGEQLDDQRAILAESERWPASSISPGWACRPTARSTDGRWASSGFARRLARRWSAIIRGGVADGESRTARRASRRETWSRCSGRAIRSPASKKRRTHAKARCIKCERQCAGLVMSAFSRRRAARQRSSTIVGASL